MIDGIEPGPLQPGWSLTSFYYHASVPAGGDVAVAREFELRRIPTDLTLSANLSASLNASGDLGVVIPMYVFPSPDAAARSPQSGISARLSAANGS